MVIPHVGPNDGHEEISETLVFSSSLIRLIAREDFSTSIHRESFKSYIRDFFFSLCHYVHTGPGAHPPSYTMDTGCVSLGSKAVRT
jgi:hypothetical protein